MEQCRICLDYGNNLESLDCNCKNDKYVHFDCAYRWYRSKTKITVFGYMDQPKWRVLPECFCEICRTTINTNILYRFIAKSNESYLVC